MKCQICKNRMMMIEGKVLLCLSCRTVMWGQTGEVEEKKTLSDRVFCTPKHDFWGYEHTYVKEALKEFIEWASDIALIQESKGVIKNKAKEIFGERLI